MLFDIAKKDKDTSIRELALSRIVEESKDWNSRIDALNQITSQGRLGYIARFNKDSIIRKIAIERLDTQWTLEEALKSETDIQNRIAIVQRLTEQKTLADVAKNDESYAMRYEAATRLTDQNFAQKIYADCALNINNYLYMPPCDKLFEKFTDQMLLAKVAKITENTAVYEAAKQKLADQDLIDQVTQKRIALCEKGNHLWVSDGTDYRDEGDSRYMHNDYRCVCCGKGKRETTNSYKF